MPARRLTPAALDALDLDDDSVVDDQIQSIVAHPFALVRHGHLHLSIEGQVLVVKLERHRILVRALVQAWTECAMHFDRTPDDAFGQVVYGVVHDEDDEQEVVRLDERSEGLRNPSNPRNYQVTPL